MRQTPLAGASPIRRSVLYVAILVMVLAAATAILALCGKAHAEEIQQCQPHKAMLEQLDKLFKETVVDSGVILDSNSEPIGIFELTGSPKGGWTVIVTDKNGMACIKANGDQLVHVAVKPAGQDA